MYSTDATEDPRMAAMDFKGKLSRACELRRLTNQRELAELARVSKSSLNRWLQGVSFPDINEAARLAQILEVPLDWLASDDDQEVPPEGESMAEDESALLRVYRSLKRTGSLNEDLAIQGLMIAAKMPMPARTAIQGEPTDPETGEPITSNDPRAAKRRRQA